MTRKRIRRWLIGITLGTLVLGLALALTGRWLPSYPSRVDPARPYPAGKIAAAMDPWLLAEGLASEVVVEVDWVEGCKPGPRSLGGLERVLREYGPPERRVNIVRSDQIPRRVWQELVAGESAASFTPIVERFVSTVSSPGTECLYVLFAPAWKSYFGISTRWVVTRRGRPAFVRGVLVFRDQHRRYARAWIDLDRLERMTLIHELGHQFGLVSDPRHERRARAHHRHCTHLDCPMNHPTFRVIAHNFLAGLFNVFMDDYCDQCRAEIQTAQRIWREQRRRDPDWEARLRHERAVQLQEVAAHARLRNEPL